MKICILSSFEDSLSYDTGYSVRIYNLAKNLAKLGNKVFLIIPGFNTGIKKINGITVYTIKGFFPLWILRFLSRALGITKKLSLYFYDPIFILRAREIIQKCDIIQIEQQSTGVFLAIMANKIWRKVVVADCHDVLQAIRVKHTNALRRTLELFCENIFYKFVNLILTVSEEEKRLLIFYGLKEAKIRVIPNGTDIIYLDDEKRTESIFQIKKKYGLDGCRVVVFVGNMEYLPNLEAVKLIAFTIAPAVMKKVPNVKFLVIGRVPEKIKINMPNLIFTGKVDRVTDFLLASDVAIAPLLRGSGTRLKILEYFSCALPVVSTSIGVSGLNIRNSLHALITDDINEFSRMIIKLLENRELALRLGKTAKQFAIMNYNWKTIAKRLDIIYEQILKGVLD